MLLFNIIFVLLPLHALCYNTTIPEDQKRHLICLEKEKILVFEAKWLFTKESSGIKLTMPEVFQFRSLNVYPTSFFNIAEQCNGKKECYISSGKSGFYHARAVLELEVHYDCIKDEKYTLRTIVIPEQDDVNRKFFCPDEEIVKIISAEWQFIDGKVKKLNAAKVALYSTLTRQEYPQAFRDIAKQCDHRQWCDLGSVDSNMTKKPILELIVHYDCVSEADYACPNNKFISKHIVPKIYGVTQLPDYAEYLNRQRIQRGWLKAFVQTFFIGAYDMKYIHDPKSDKCTFSYEVEKYICKNFGKWECIDAGKEAACHDTFFGHFKYEDSNIGSRK